MEIINIINNMSKKRIITDINITEAWKRGLRSIEIDSNTIITPQANDSAKTKNIVFVKLPDAVQRSREVKELLQISIGSDHAGFRMKEFLKRYLIDIGHELHDMGTFSEEPVDYPDIALKVALQVKENLVDFGIILDGTGIPSSIVANKIPGIRAAACPNEISAKISREHNNANILTLGSRILGEELVKSVTNAFITTKFSEGMHLKRLEKIRDIEKRFSK
jgi:ribose 5-phosphate isomerase B